MTALILKPELIDQELSRRSFDDYCRYVMQLEPAKHHLFVNDKLMAVERGEINRLMIFEPPGHAKSTYASVGFPAWFVGNNPTDNIICASHAKDLAEGFSRKVRGNVKSDEYINVFSIDLSKESSSVSRWQVEYEDDKGQKRKGAEYYAVGIGSSVTGKRAKGGIIDDPVKGAKEARSPVVQASTFEWYKTDFRTRLLPGAFIIIMQTRWDTNDLSGKILPEDYDGRSGWVKARDGEMWYVINLPALAREGDILGRKAGEALWPEFYTQEMMEQERRTQGEHNFAALYQQLPVAASGNEFKSEWIQYFNPLKGIVLGECNLWILVDPANEKKATSDYTAIVVVALAPDNNYYIMEIIRDRFNPTERIQKVMDTHKKWNQLAGKPPQVAYEKYGMMTDTHYLRAEQDKQGYRFAIQEVGGTMKKEDRIRRLIPIFEQRRLWLPYNQIYVTMNKSTTELVMDFVKNEYEPFPYGSHDDVLDAMARIFDVNASFPMITKRYRQNVRAEFEEPEERDSDWMDI
jgi:predicted phage terminase large subunit-like protein